MADFFSYIFNIIGNIWLSFWGVWIALGFIVGPIAIIYLLYKHRKNKERFMNILRLVIGFILFVSFFTFLKYCNQQF